MFRQNSGQSRFKPRGQFTRNGGSAFGRGRFSGGGGRGQTDHSSILRAIAASSLSNQTGEQFERPTVAITNTFADFQIAPLIKANIAAKGYVSPTPIQDQAIPAVLSGRDVIGIANTGTGKTGAFLIPLIDKVSKNHAEKVLILTPTRELALQIYDEFREFAKGMGIYATLCIGGGSMWRQRSELRQNPSFVIGTPGRIKDFVSDRDLNLSRFGNVVLDEADRMVDIGFIKDIQYFISLLPPVRQSLFFSATISGKVAEVLQNFVKNPVTVSVKVSETSKNIHQSIVKIPSGQRKVDFLHEMLKKEEFNKVLIFGRTKWAVQKLADELSMRGLRAGAIHGNKNQSQRQRVLFDFKNDNIKILLATDVASRGLDIENVSHVINYELPDSYDDYVHRIGRTGRANKQGIALTLVE